MRLPSLLSGPPPAPPLEGLYTHHREMLQNITLGKVLPPWAHGHGVHWSCPVLPSPEVVEGTADMLAWK